MRVTRRYFIVSSAAAAGTITLLPFAAQSVAHASDIFTTSAGDITIHPVSHASFVMETPVGTIYVDPVGEGSAYADFRAEFAKLIGEGTEVKMGGWYG